MIDENTDIQLQLSFLHNAEKQAVQGMLLTALEHGFQLNDLLLLASVYNASAAMLEYRNGECVVNYATAEGYDRRNFGLHYQDAFDFAEGFGTWWYQ
ncbi:MAG: hypothetical protein ACRCWW_08585 [Scandinavium sp.]|uniref:hypothetical protein n=1 Tax=Scandinavium sp. TaxID=2830653 RepID=UPI003F2E2EE2